MSKEKKYIWVKWFDASYNEHCMNPKSFSPNYVIETVGILIKEDKNYIVLVTDWVDEEWCRHYHSIPKANIIKRRWLK